MTEHKTNLVGLSREEMTAALSSIGMEKFRTKQVWQWIYWHGLTDFEGMTNISKTARKKLDEHFYIGRPKIDRYLTSKDGTRKWLLEYEDGNKAEVVFIPSEEMDDGRGTLCISSQIGCTLSCRFCHTGTQLLVRNLTSSEIVSQILVARDTLKEWSKEEDGRYINNIVIMGMGEPLYNYDNMAQAIKIMMDCEGLSFSRRRITLSTSGVVPEIKRCGEELGVNLAVSLHAVDNEVRSQIMPINRKYPIEMLMEACREYLKVSNTRRITFEYIMLKDINDSDDDARNLVKLLDGMSALVNLIPFNKWEGAKFERPSNNRIRSFAKIIFEAGYASPIRKSRGEDIYAACGQLKSDSERIPRYIKRRQMAERQQDNSAS